MNDSLKLTFISKSGITIQDICYALSGAGYKCEFFVPFGATMPEIVQVEKINEN